MSRPRRRVTYTVLHPDRPVQSQSAGGIIVSNCTDYRTKRRAMAMAAREPGYVEVLKLPLTGPNKVVWSRDA